MRLTRRGFVVAGAAGSLASVVSCKQTLADAGERSVDAAAPASAPQGRGGGLALVDDAVSQYAEAHSVAESPAMKAIADETRSSIDMWIMMVGPMEAALLRLLVQLGRAKRVLEVGTFTGYSAMAMAEGLPDDGELVTLDISEAWTAIARKHWATSPHGKKIRLELGPAAQTLARLEGPFDLAFIDADKPAYPGYWDAIVPMMRPGGVVVADNVLAGGGVVDPDDERARVMAAFNDKVRADTRVSPVMLPIRDGVTIARVDSR
jgi:caffeoyl-CoA O-methyltransferase